jgi:hypothetical protein
MGSNSFTFAHDELVLILIALVRATHPSMLRQESDGFSFDFQILDSKKVLDDDEKLIFKIRALLDSATQAENEQPSRDVSLSPDESRRVALGIAHLQRLQPWPLDVVNLCRNITSRLSQ